MSDVTNNTSNGSQYLTFMLNQENYGLPISSVREINRVSDITPVPKTTDFIKGVMNLRGKIIPVISLRVKFGMHEEKFTRDTCIIVIDSAAGQFGAIVDNVKEVVTLRTEQIEPAPHMGPQKIMNYITGMGKLESRVIVLVDVVTVLATENIDNLQKSNLSEKAA